MICNPGIKNEVINLILAAILEDFRIDEDMYRATNRIKEIFFMEGV